MPTKSVPFVPLVSEVTASKGTKRTKGTDIVLPYAHARAAGSRHGTRRSGVSEAARVSSSGGTAHVVRVFRSRLGGGARGFLYPVDRQAGRLKRKPPRLGSRGGSFEGFKWCRRPPYSAASVDITRRRPSARSAASSTDNFVGCIGSNIRRTSFSSFPRRRARTLLLMPA